MKKKIIGSLFLVLALVTYIFVYNRFHIGLVCLTYEITGLYCPGCGSTRMFTSLFRGEFYQAFRYNPLLAIVIILYLFYYLYNLYCLATNKKSVLSKIEPYSWYALIVVFIVYGILRNIPVFDFLAPTKI